MQSVDGDIRLSVAFDQKSVTQATNALKKSIENSMKATSGGGTGQAVEGITNSAKNARTAMSELSSSGQKDLSALEQEITHVHSMWEQALERAFAARAALKAAPTSAAANEEYEAANIALNLLEARMGELLNNNKGQQALENINSASGEAARGLEEVTAEAGDTQRALTDLGNSGSNMEGIANAEQTVEEFAQSATGNVRDIQAEIDALFDMANGASSFSLYDGTSNDAAAIEEETEAVEHAVEVEAEYATAHELVREHEEAEARARAENTAATTEETNATETQISLKERLMGIFARLRPTIQTFGGVMRSTAGESITFLGRIKQIGSSVKKVSSALKEVTSPILNFAKSVATSAKRLLSHASASKKARSGAFNLEGALKKGIKTILRYGLGIRSTYVLFNKLRTAIKEGYKNLAGFSPEVNASISGILSSLERLKNQLAAAFEPIVTVVAPYIKQLIDWANRGALAIAKFFGALTGRQTVYKAAEQNKQYIESLNDTADAAKDAQEAVEKYLSPLDDLNIYKDPNESAVSSATEKTTSGQETPDYASMFTVEPIENKFIELTNQIKDRFSTIFEPIKTAWDKVGGQVKNSMTNTFSSVTGLIKSIGTSFSTVWQNGTGEAVAQNLFLAFTSVNDMIKNISDNFRNAWESGRGIEIADRLGTLFENVSKKIKDVAASWAEWAKDVDFEPLLTGIRDLLDSVIALFDDSNKNFSLTEDLIQPIASWTIEEAIPAFLQLLSDFLTFVSTSGDTVAKALSDIWTSIFGDVTPGDMLIAAINSISDLFKWLTEHQEVVEIITKIATVVLGVAGVVQVFSTVAGIVSGIGAAVAFLATPVGAIALLIGGIIALIISIKSNWETLKEALEIALEFWKEKFKELGEEIAGFWNKLKDGARKAWESIKSVFGTVATFFGNIFSTAWEKVKAVFSKGGEIFKGIKEGILNAFKKVVNSLIDGINTVVAIPFKGINSALSAIHDVEIVGYQPFDWIKTIDIPQIPHLATGAVIPANREFLAVLGDQTSGRNIEAPEDLIRQIVREEAGRGNGVQHIHLHVGSREIAEAVVEGGRVIMGQTGANPFVMA